jgi:addiction module HigA family antidote
VEKVKKAKRRPLHPGEILREQFLADYGLSMNRLARDLRIPVTRVAEIVHERRGLSADTALRLARYFRTSPEFWMNLQTAYELDLARGEGKQIERDVRPLEAA